MGMARSHVDFQTGTMIIGHILRNPNHTFLYNSYATGAGNADAIREGGGTLLLLKFAVCRRISFGGITRVYYGVPLFKSGKVAL